MVDGARKVSTLKSCARLFVIEANTSEVPKSESIVELLVVCNMLYWSKVAQQCCNTVRDGTRLCHLDLFSTSVISSTQPITRRLNLVCWSIVAKADDPFAAEYGR